VHGPVDATAIVRGYAYGLDQYVLIDPADLDRLRPARDRALVLEQCVAVAALDPALFAGRSLFLLPDGPAAQPPYRVVAAALAARGQGALGRVVLAGRRHLVLVRPVGQLLALDLLHCPAQLSATTPWEFLVAGPPPAPEELRLAGRLVEAVSGPPDWPRYRDTTAEELAALIEAAAARQPRPAPADEPAAIVQFLEALTQSVAAAEARPAPAPARVRTPRAPRRTRP
jgi:DNA end-binding protein Ku